MWKLFFFNAHLSFLCISQRPQITEWWHSKKKKRVLASNFSPKNPLCVIPIFHWTWGVTHLSPVCWFHSVNSVSVDVSHSVSPNSETPWTCSHQAPLSRGFSRQEHWSVLPCPPPGDLPDSRTESGSPASQADSYCLSPQGSPQETHRTFLKCPGKRSDVSQTWNAWLLHCLDLIS